MYCAICIELSNDADEWAPAITAIDGIAICLAHKAYLPDYYSDDHPLNQAADRIRSERLEQRRTQRH